MTEKIEFHNEKRKISDLLPYRRNPRKLSEKQARDLRDSLSKFRLAEVPVINTNNTILAGHQRIKILAELEGVDKEIDVRVPNRKLTREEANEYLIRSNKNTGEWDFEVLAENFMYDDLVAWGFEDIELTMFDEKTEIGQIDDIPTIPIKAKSKFGTIYHLGKHRLICGDSTSRNDIVRLMDGEKAAMCFTDPPYNIDYRGGMSGNKSNERDKILNDKMSKNSFYQFLFVVSKNILENTIGGVYICMSSSELDTLKRSFEDAGGHWQSFIIWVKNMFTLSRSDYQHIYEPILYGWSATTKNHYFVQHRDIPNVVEDLHQVKTIFDGEHTTIKFQGFEVKLKGRVEGTIKRRKQKIDIWRYDKPRRSEEHPTMKPVSLCAEAIKNSSVHGEIVLDLFGGSGSTLIACEQLGRRCFMCELDPKYCDVIRKRYWKFTHGTDKDWERGTI